MLRHPSGIHIPTANVFIYQYINYTVFRNRAHRKRLTMSYDGYILVRKSIPTAELLQQYSIAAGSYPHMRISDTSTTSVEIEVAELHRHNDIHEWITRIGQIYYRPMTWILGPTEIDMLKTMSENLISKVNAEPDGQKSVTDTQLHNHIVLVETFAQLKRDLAHNTFDVIYQLSC